MPTRLETLKLEISTGDHGNPGPVRISFNGFELELNRISGGTEPGEDYVGEYFVSSVIHSCTLLGPTDGSWKIKELKVVCDLGEEGIQQTLFPAFELAAGEQKDLQSPPEFAV